MTKKLPVPFLVLPFAMTTGVAVAQDMGVVTGSRRGTYGPFGLNMSKLAKQRGIRSRVDESRGSVQNVFAVFKAPETPLSVNPVLDAFKKMFSA